MKRSILLCFVMCHVIVFAQQTETLDRVPMDFLDLFNKERRNQEFVRTNTNLVIAAGFNQAISGDNGIGDSYQFIGSNIFEIGLEFRTRLKPKNDQWRFNYGLAMRMNSLSINDNKAFFTNNNMTRLEPIGFNANSSNFTQINIVVPFHFEVGSRKLKIYQDNMKRYRDNNAFVLGLGGYLGFVSTSSQAIKFDREDRGVTLTTTNDYMINELLYGISAYSGWDNLQFFASYGLNYIFKKSPLQERMLSFGIRLR